jgi:hypothetical protein
MKKEERQKASEVLNERLMGVLGFTWSSTDYDELGRLRALVELLQGKGMSSEDIRVAVAAPLGDM